MPSKAFDEYNNAVPVLSEDEINEKLQEHESTIASQVSSQIASQTYTKPQIDSKISAVEDKIPSSTGGLTLNTNIGSFSSSANTNSDGRIITNIISVAGSRSSTGGRIGGLTYKTFTTSRGTSISGTLSNVLSRLAYYAHNHSFGSAVTTCPCNNVCVCNCDDNDNSN